MGAWKKDNRRNVARTYLSEGFCLTAMDFETYKYRAAIEEELKKFLPQQITASWVEHAVGKARWVQDTKAITEAMSEPLWDFLSRGGKRWRPMFMLMCCEAVGGDAQKNLPFTVIPELIHNATLISDDIEDNSDLRRGKPVLHKVFGMDIALNAGETLYALPYVAIRDSNLSLDLKCKAYEIISGQLLKCYLGQAIDIRWHHTQKEIPTEEMYLQMTANKSGSLACMAAKLGALLGGGSAQQVEALGRFGETAGVVFQIQDDILNITQNKNLGKDFGDDIKEGKRTLLVIHTLCVAPEEEKKRLLEILNMHTNDEKLLQEAIDLIVKHDSVAYCKKIALELAEQTWKETERVLPESPVKEELREFAQLLLNRVV